MEWDTKTQYAEIRHEKVYQAGESLTTLKSKLQNIPDTVPTGVIWAINIVVHETKELLP